MHRHRSFLAWLAFAPALGLQAAPTLVLHVSAKGPLTTLAQARDAIRKLKTEHGGKLEQPVTVLIHAGTYRFSEPLRLTAEDSGTVDCPVTYAAFEKDQPVLSGGRAIGSWKKVTVEGKHLWAAEIPDVRDGKWYFHQLWMNGSRRQRARNPNQGFFRIAAVPDMKLSDKYQVGQTRFQFNPGEIKTYQNLDDVELNLMTFWLSTRLGIAALDAQQNMVTLSRRSTFRLTDGFGRQPMLGRYYVENAFELLDAPGEWYLDRKTGMLYYMPMPGENIRNATAEAPMLDSLLLIDGAEHITFRGLSFEYSEWWVPRNDPHSKYQRQGSVYVPAMIQLTHARSCSFESCTMAHLSQYAIHFSHGSEHDRVSHCRMFDLGTGGVKIGDPEPNDPAHDIEVSDNHIYDGGATFHGSHAIWIGMSHDNLVSHNHVHDFYYIAISVGWSWNYGPPLARNNIIEYNHVHDIGKGWLSDMGAIYTLGYDPGTVIRYNLLHDVECAAYGGSGIYFDMGTAGITAEKNIVYRTSTGGLHQNYGKENIVRNNIFAFGRDGQIELGSAPGALPGPNEYLFEHNIVYWEQGHKVLASPWNNTAVVYRNNLYWQEGGSEPAFGRFPWSDWRANGMDAGSIIADPLFVDAAHNDFRLKPGSPAAQIGFEPFDLSSAGPRP